MTERVGWLDASSGISGDMVLGALLGAGVPLEVVQEAVDAVAPEPIGLTVDPVSRAGFAATRCQVTVADSGSPRTWRDIRTLIAAARLDAAVGDLALAIFGTLAEAEARVHGIAVEEVHFHEVGALDAIADVVGAAAGFVHLGLDQVICSPVALGAGSVTTAHGRLPVPVPAVVELLRNTPTYGGPIDRELTTPTGAAILATVVTGSGPQPAMAVEHTGVGAGSANPDGHANVLRLFLGRPAAGGAQTDGPSGAAVLLETNIDDLDPRLWPDVIAALLAAGASDAWLSPILMKKGRPAHTLHVLVHETEAADVRAAIFTHTSTIGLRETRVGKRALDREYLRVEVDGHPISVKLARLDGVLMNTQPEYEDVAAAARALGRAAKDVLAEASALARSLTS